MPGAGLHMLTCGNKVNINMIANGNIADALCLFFALGVRTQGTIPQAVAPQSVKHENESASGTGVARFLTDLLSTLRLRTVSVTCRLLVFSSIAFVAATMLGDARVQAGYVCVSAATDADDTSVLAPLVEKSSPAGIRGAFEMSQTSPSRDAQPIPSEPDSPSRKLPFGDYNCGHSHGAGSTSRPSSNSGTGHPPAGDVSRLDLPPLQLTALFRPQTVAVHPNFAASSLFHPPRG